MKKVLVVAALLGVMLLTARFHGAGGGAATLAAIGFVALAAYAVAELGKSLSLPQVTGYILAGVALGPSAGGIISGDVVAEMRMFNTLALGLIATSAGLELDARQIARLGRTLVFTTAIKLVVGVPLVALTMFGVETALGGLGLSRNELVAVALVMGVLSLGTSPSIVLAVLSETRARGRLSELVLGAAVFKDLVVVVGLAVALAVARTVLDPSAQLDASLLGAVARELGGSILAGSLVGGILIAYVRFVGAEMLLFVAAMILVVAEVCRALHLELLLVFITAGFVVRNLSELEHRLLEPLELVALPVFVVFFANAGASIELRTTWAILPLALALCTVRAATYVLASRWGGKWAGEAVLVQRRAWLAYLPQAGVTLGLVGLAGLQLPVVSHAITTTGMAVVAINLLLGPITLRRALALARELPGQKAAALTDGSPAPVSPSPLPARAARHLPDSLRWAHERLRVSLGDVLARFAREVAPHLPTLPDGDSAPDPQVFAQLVLGHRSAYQALYAELTGLLGELPAAFEISASESLAPGQRRALRPSRLPLRRIARIALEPQMARHVASLFEEGLRQRVGSPGALASGAPAPEQPELPEPIALGLEQFAELLLEASTGSRSARKLRYSEVEPRIRHQLEGLAGATQADLVRVARAAWASRVLERRALETSAQLHEVITRQVIEPGRSVARQLDPALASLAAWLNERQGDLAARGLDAAAVAQLRSDFEHATRAALGELARDFRVSTTLRLASGALQSSIEGLPGSIECLYLEPGAPLHQGRVETFDLQERAAALVRQLAPAVDSAVRSLGNAFAHVPARVSAAVHPEWVLLETRTEQGRSVAPGALARDCLAATGERVMRVARLTERASEAALAALETAVETAVSSFLQQVTSRRALPGRRAVLLQKPLTRLRQLSQRLVRLALELARRRAHPDDAASVRSLLAVGATELPEALSRWFSESPVSDERIFAAHRALLESIVDAEALRAKGSPTSVLIIGSRGSGKSSLLNLCELESRSGTPLRLRAGDFDRNTTLFQALGALLESPPTHAGLARHLELERSALFVDDLEAWVSAALDRQRELLAILQLIAETRAQVFWVVTIDRAMLQVFSELANVREVFTNVVELPPLTLPEVERLVGLRLERSRLPVTIQPTRLGRLLHRLRLSRLEDGVYRSLRAVSGGNPGRIVAACRNSFAVHDGRVVLRADAIGPGASLAFPWTAVQLALLATLLRYGPLPRHRLARELAVPEQELERSVAFLAASGLLSEVEHGSLLSISGTARWAALDAVEQARIAGGPIG